MSETMKTPKQWLKERCVPEGPLWESQPTWADWIKAIQDDATTSLRERLKQVEAEEVVMRLACEQALKNLCDSGSGSVHDPSWIRPKKIGVSEVQQLCIQAYHQLHQALSTSAGKTYLARMEEAERLLSETPYYPDGIKRKDWEDRRDTLLEQLKGGV